MISTIWLGVIIVGGFCIWKFVLQPILNEGEPIEPPKDYKPFTQQLEEEVHGSVNTELDI